MELLSRVRPPADRLAVLALGPLDRVRRGARRHGLRVFWEALRLAGHSVCSTERHVWYELHLGAAVEPRELPGGLEVVDGSPADLPRADSLWPLARREGRRRLAQGSRLWLVEDGDQLAFSCWTFPGRLPVRAARGRWLQLPADTVGLDESVTAAAYRGRGIGPAAWSAIARSLETEGTRRIVTPVEETNIASRRAVEKAGFLEIATTTVIRRGRKRVHAALLDPLAGAFLLDSYATLHPVSEREPG